MFASATMSGIGGEVGQQHGGDVTPQRASAEGVAHGSPAGKRSRVEAMRQPVVDASEHYNHEELVQQVRELKANMRVVGVSTMDLLDKHNTFVHDVEQGIGGLMETSRMQYHDMGRIKDGCTLLEKELHNVHGVCAGLHQRMEAFEGFRAENGEKLDIIATAAQEFKNQVRDMEASLGAKVQKIELETVPADLRRAHEGMKAELARFRAEHGGGLAEGQIAALIEKALSSETFEMAIMTSIEGRLNSGLGENLQN